MPALLRHPFSRRLGIALAVALAAALIFMLHAQASSPAPPQPTQPNVTYTCQKPIDAARSVQVAHEEYYACVEPLTDKWLRSHPEHVERLEAQYEVWEETRQHDLRDRPAAAQFVDDHPVDFSRNNAELSAKQVDQMRPDMAAEPAEVTGDFQRFFVAGEAARLFLTSATEGLVSLDISDRYAFNVEGSVGESGAEDFFVVNDRIAVTEEENTASGARDLVVLDISDRSAPREIRRLDGAIPAVAGPTTYLHKIPSRAPTFAEYRAIRNGTLRLNNCGHPPTVSTHPGQKCRPDGSCYRTEQRSEPLEDGYCERNVVNAPPPRPLPGGQLDGGGGGGATKSAPNLDFDGSQVDGQVQAPAARERSAAGAADEEAAEPTPQGGKGGAGSLSQMMVHGDMLFVLSGKENVSRGWLTSFDISNPRRPEFVHLIGLDNGPEALQRHDNLLLIAGRDALVTASIGAEDGPRLLGERRQVCPVNYDPVVVEGSVAYRTIIVDQPRSQCRSRLEVIDLSQPHSPNMRTSRNLQKPRGLAVLDNRLFIADEAQGIRVFDTTDPVAPAPIGTWNLRGVKDLVLNEFDLYAMTAGEIRNYYVGPLFEAGANAKEASAGIEGVKTVVRAQ